MSNHHWQGIVTRYVGPTNNRPSRVVANSAFHRVMVAWDHSLGPYENHLAAATALSFAMGQGRPSVECGPEWDFIGAESPGRNGYVFIMVDAPSRVAGCVRRNQ